MVVWIVDEVSEAYDSSGRNCMDIDASGGLAPPSVSTTTPNSSLSSIIDTIIARLKAYSTLHSLLLSYYNINNITFVVYGHYNQF